MHYFFVVEPMGRPSAEENEHTIQAAWFTVGEIRELDRKFGKLFHHIDTYQRVKEQNSFFDVNQIYSTDNEIMKA